MAKNMFVPIAVSDLCRKMMKIENCEILWISAITKTYCQNAISWNKVCENTCRLWCFQRLVLMEPLILDDELHLKNIRLQEGHVCAVLKKKKNKDLKTLRLQIFLFADQPQLLCLFVWNHALSLHSGLRHSWKTCHVEVSRESLGPAGVKG